MKLLPILLLSAALLISTGVDAKECTTPEQFAAQSQTPNMLTGWYDTEDSRAIYTYFTRKTDADRVMKLQAYTLLTGPYPIGLVFSDKDGCIVDFGQTTIPQIKQMQVRLNPTFIMDPEVKKIIDKSRGDAI